MRTDLARKVARLWEEKLMDAREAADAWRRVLRMKSGDSEAAEGLDRAKSNMLKRSTSDAPSLAADLTSETASEQGADATDLPDSKPAIPAKIPPPTFGKSAAPKPPLKTEADARLAPEEEADADVTRRDTLTSSMAEGLRDDTGEPSDGKVLDADKPSGIDVEIESEADNRVSSPDHSAKALPFAPQKRVDSSESQSPSRPEGSTPRGVPPHAPAAPPGPPARRAPPPPPMRSSARPPPPVPPTKGAPAVRMPPPPPSLRPNLPPSPPSPIHPAGATAQPPGEVEEADEDGISVDDSELLE